MATMISTMIALASIRQKLQQAATDLGKKLMANVVLVIQRKLPVKDFVFKSVNFHKGHEGIPAPLLKICLMLFFK